MYCNPTFGLLVADAAYGVPYSRQTVYYQFRNWRLDGRLRRAHDRLRAAVREAVGRERDPSAALIDSQVVKTTPVGGPDRGYDGPKRLAGRKRHLLEDTNGLVLAAQVHGADLPDRDGGRRLLAEELQWELPRMEMVWAGGAYTSGFRQWPMRSGDGGWRCRITPIGSFGATVWRRSRAVSGCYLAAAWWGGRSPGVGAVAAVQQGLREAAGDGGGNDLRRDEPTHAAQVGAGGVKDLRSPRAADSPFAKLPLRRILVSTLYRLCKHFF
jgi:hypothetical protein